MSGIPGLNFLPLPIPMPFGGNVSVTNNISFGDVAGANGAAASAPAAGGSFADSVRSAGTPGEKRDLIDAYSAGFIAAARGNMTQTPAPAVYVPSCPTHGAPQLPTSITSPVAGVPTLAGIQNARLEGFAGVMEGFQNFAGLVEESNVPDHAKNATLDGLAALMEQFASYANLGGADRSQPAPVQQPVSSANDVWTHEQGDDGTAKIRLGDKYTIDLKEGDQSFTIRNNETGETTRIWGDPHVDSDGDGKTDFDFKKDMTFVLEDGTKITVNTVPADNGTTYSSALTITNGDNAIQVTGLAGKHDGANNLKVVQSNAGRMLDALTDDGAQSVYRRGDDWVDAQGRSVTQSIINAGEGV